MDSSSCFSLNRFRGKSRSHSYNSDEGPSPGLPEAICRRFSLAEIERATQGFHPDKIIGKGGFCTVHKGCLDDDKTTQVSIKRLHARSSVHGRSQFRREAELCSQLRHPNLVAFRGFCDEHDEMINVHEYMPHGRLAHHLFRKGETLIWRRRLLICIDIARGLHYLHSGVKQTIIHRNLTAHNILLGHNWVAKLSDLGLSETSKPSMRASSRVVGTLGYVEPEYILTGKLTEKTDIYSFGVVLFEVLSGRRVFDRRLEESSYSLGWMLECQQNGTLHEMVDPCVKGEIAPECLRRFLDIAEGCVHEDRTERPGIEEIQVALEDALEFQTASRRI